LDRRNVANQHGAIGSVRDDDRFDVTDRSNTPYPPHQQLATSAVQVAASNVQVSIGQREFDVVFTPGARRLPVHTDLPGKVVSFILALPPEDPGPEAEAMNGTVLYDAGLAAVARAPYRANAACLFAPHLESYHGFDTVGARDVFVTFYEDPIWMARWHALQGRECPPYDAYKDLVAARLAEEPLIEIGGDAEAIARHRARSAIDGPMGRVSGRREPGAEGS